MNCVLNFLNNTFFGTLFAGILITILGFWLYSRQKQIDLSFDDLRKLRESAAALYAVIESASNKIEGLFNLYDGKNPQLSKPLHALGDEFEKVLVEKMGNELVNFSNEILTLSENFVTKIKIKNLFNVDMKKVSDNVSIMNLYLQGAPFTLQKLKTTEVEEWREGWNKSKAAIQVEISKLLT